MILEAEGLHKHYGKGDPVLDGVSLRADASELVLLSGPNGSGKTTLLAVLAGVRHHRAGQIRVGGTPVDQAGSRIGWCAAAPPAPAHHTPRTAMHWVSDLRGGDAAAWVSRLDLEGVADRPLPRLSAGQQKRVGLALALMGSPDLLLLDEPLSALDPDGIDRVVEAVAEALHRGAAVVASTHRADAFSGLAPRHLQLRHGVLVEAS